ncbi:16S rRNA (guanine(966)-N(2))-methyltransferase RsmD [Alteromonadaceae bacterium BrNp21-10]|nr:16S rRNA (guanine(966)-N(2))-methyltransferase RsmD [Alteromonadaceae bacterium BrNp21-10]
MKRQAKQKNTASGSIRIIAGQWRGRKLPVLDAEGLRPTTDRTKETLFNWLAPEIVGRTCLDAFSGSGSLGFEALSRGAKQVDFVDMNASACRQIEQNISTLNIPSKQAKVMNVDVLAYLQQHQTFDLVFIDPPFNQGLITPLLTALNQTSKLAKKALIYIECELANANYPVPNSWQCIKQKQTKQLSYRLYQCE